MLLFKFQAERKNLERQLRHMKVKQDEAMNAELTVSQVIRI